MITNDYPYIRAWGRYMRLKKSVVDKKLWMARREGAPANAFAYEYNANINAQSRKRKFYQPLQYALEG